MSELLTRGPRRYIIGKLIDRLTYRLIDKFDFTCNDRCPMGERQIPKSKNKYLNHQGETLTCLSQVFDVQKEPVKRKKAFVFE